MLAEKRRREGSSLRETTGSHVVHYSDGACGDLTTETDMIERGSSEHGAKGWLFFFPHLSPEEEGSLEEGKGIRCGRRPDFMNTDDSIC